MIGELFKYLFLSFSPLLIYLRFITTVIFDNFITNNFSSKFTNSYLENINKSQTSLCLTNNVFLFGQEEIISVSNTPVNIVTNPIFLKYFYYKSYSFFTKKIILKSESKFCTF